MRKKAGRRRSVLVPWQCWQVMMPVPRQRLQQEMKNVSYIVFSWPTTMAKDATWRQQQEGWV